MRTITFFALILFFIATSCQAQSPPYFIHYHMSKSALLHIYPTCHFRNSSKFDTTFLEETDLTKMEIMYCDSFPLFGMSGTLGVVFSKDRIERVEWITKSESAFNKIHALIGSFAEVGFESEKNESIRRSEWRTKDRKELLSLSFDSRSNAVVFTIDQNDED